MPGPSSRKVTLMYSPGFMRAWGGFAPTRVWRHSIRSLPAGVSLYWLTTNFLQIIQQFAMEWYEKRHPKEAPKPGDDRKTASEKEPAARGSKGPPAKAQAGAQTRRSAAAKGQAKPAGEKQKAAARKGAPPQKSKAAAQKGGKKPSSQVRRPKGPPPQQKKPQKGAGGKGGTRKR